MYLLRPVLAEPPMCTISELKTTLNIDDLADMHELLNIKEVQNAAIEG